MWQVWLIDFWALKAVQREGTVWVKPGLSQRHPVIIRMIMADTRLGPVAILASVLKQLSQ